MLVIGICGNEQTSKIIAVFRKIIDLVNIKTSIIKSDDLYTSTPPRITLKNYIDELDKNNVEIAVIKIIPDRAIEGAYENINFNVLVYDNIKEDSQEMLDNEKVGRYKRVFELMKKKDIAIVNNDDSTVLELLKGSKMCVITYGLSSKVTITASSIEQDLQSSTLNYCLQRIITTLDKRDIEPQEFPIKIVSSTDKDIYAFLAAITLAIVCGMDIKSIRQMTL